VVDQPRQRRPADASGPPALLRGMYVTIRIPIEPKTRLLEVPEAAVRPGNVVWRVRGGELAIVPVNFVALAEAEAEGSRGALIYVDASSDASQPGALQPGDQVVVSPLHYVRTGMAIETAVVGEQSGS
jgi:multidrug efflux pump subunit AcrA (membrane-fusion protein)